MSAQPSLIASPPFRALHRDFFARDPRRVARDLLSKVLVRSLEAENPGVQGALLAGRIVEVEAYLGENDPAAQAAAATAAILRHPVLAYGSAMPAPPAKG